MASVGTLSGPAGGALGEMLAGAQVWVKWVNARGGVNGHPIRLITYDDGGDPARHRAQVQEAIERRHAIAFLMNVELISGRSSVDYITEKRVPVIGMSGGEAWAYESPMYFPQHSTGLAHYEGFPAAVGTHLVAKGTRKIGTLVCVEAQGCIDVENVFVKGAETYGYELVYKGRTSLAHPDFTAECLAAQNAGVQALWVNYDVNSLKRVVRSCVRQGYRPIFMTTALATTDEIKDDPNLEGLLAVGPVFPFFQAGTSASDEYQQAMQAYGGGVPKGGGPPSGWVAGKLFEKAATNLSEPPTSASLLAGLWSLKGDDLGGLTAPLSFNRDQPPQPVVCWFVSRIGRDRWETPDGAQRHCK